MRDAAKEAEAWHPGRVLTVTLENSDTKDKLTVTSIHNFGIDERSLSCYIMALARGLVPAFFAGDFSNVLGQRRPFGRSPSFGSTTGEAPGGRADWRDL